MLQNIIYTQMVVPPGTEILLVGATITNHFNDDGTTDERI
jgi:hypothetical protein